MGRGGGGGGHMSSGGGHSSSHSGGGHYSSSSSRSSGSSFRSSGSSFSSSSGHVSRRTGGGGSFGRGPAPRGPVGGPPPPRGPVGGYGYGYGGMEPPPRPIVRSHSSLFSMLAVIIAASINITVIVAVIVAVMCTSVENNEPETTIARSKLENVATYNNNCIIDETGEFNNTSYVAAKLKDFYDLTGVQPFIIWKAYDESLQTEADKEEWALTYYDDNITAENTFLYVYFEDYDDIGEGYMYYVNGTQSVSVMDAEAVDIFWNYIDRYWWDDISTDDLFIKVFDNVGEVIMREPTNGWDALIKVIVGIIIIGAIVGIVVIIKAKAKAKHQEAEDAERILNTPVTKVDGGESSVELEQAMSKYGNNH